MTFEHRESPVSFTLFPMVHVGDEQFYEEAFRDAYAHDVVLVEGIQSSVGRNLTRSYRWLDFERLGLVKQPKPPLPLLDSVPARIVKADLTTQEFHREWRKVSLLLRAILFVAAPLFGLYMRFFGSRARIANRQSLEDRQSSEEILNWSPRFEPVYHSLLHARDKRLIECMAAEIENAKTARVAIVYGARHMRAVMRELTKRGFRCSKSTRRTIIALEW